MAPLMATQATGIPDGVWTTAYRASTPFSLVPLSGTPMIGSVVQLARTPGRWAATRDPEACHSRHATRCRTRPSRLRVAQRAPGGAGLPESTRSDPPFSSATTDAVDPAARAHNTCPLAAARPPAVGDSTARSVESLGVSQIGTAPFAQILQRFFGELVKPARSHILLELPVPSARIEPGKPSAKCRQVLR